MGTYVDAEQHRPRPVLVSAVRLEGTAPDPVTLPIDRLLCADSPRLQGEDVEHIRMLAEIEDGWPPILVCRRTMHVIDGMHRLKAARLRGDQSIQAVLYDGDEAEAFILAVKANIEHGLPLSLSDRKAAAARIVRSNPHWSDRAIAEVAGLSAKTVGVVRRDAVDALPEVRDRIGRDGRVRPLNTVDGRRYASELIVLNPDSSSREVARMAGISPSTVRDVRDRLRRGVDPVPARRRGHSRTEPPTPERGLQKQMLSERLQSHSCRDDILSKLSRDPAVRLTDDGRARLRWLGFQSKQVDRNWADLADHLPDHCSGLVADLACSIANGWLGLAREMRRRALADQ
jgi:ParB-like chromosome segregation protein Spo0J